MLNIKTHILYLTILLSSTFIAKSVQAKPIPAQTLKESNFDSSVIKLISQDSQPSTTETFRISPRFGAQFTTGPGLGYGSSFTGLEAFLPIWQTSDNQLTFVQGKLLLATTDTLTSGNLVLGHRFFSAKDNRVIGTYVAYDSRNTGNSKFNQIGAGFESLGEFWDARANFYIPINNTRQVIGESTSQSFSAFSAPRFQENFLVQTRDITQQLNRRFEVALPGFDIEAGFKLASIGETGDVRAYGGFYYYDAPGTDKILGGRARLEVNPTDSLKLGLLLSSDDTFGTNLVFNFGASLGSSRTGYKKSAIARLGSSVYRTENIVVDQAIESTFSSGTETVQFTNPATGQPWRFQHVVLGSASGNGTFETPAGTVADALTRTQPSDIVYVQSGNNSEIASFTIPTGVQVLSSRVVQQIDTTQLGLTQLPSSDAGALPTVAGTVTMGNNTTLSGFNIASTPEVPGIAATNVSNFTIKDNRIAAQFAPAIAFTNINGKATVTNNTIQNSSPSAFSLNSNSGAIDLDFTRNTVTNNGNGVFITLENTAQGNFNISNNTLTQNQSSGIDIRLSDSARATFNINDNNISQNARRGIDLVLANTSQGTFNIGRNSITNNLEDGIYLETDNASQATINISNNTAISRNGTNGIVINANANSLIRLVVENNPINSNSVTGLQISSLDDARVVAGVTSNNITINTLSDLDAITIGTGANICLRPRNNQIGVLNIDDTIGGSIQIENGIPSNNTVSTSNVNGSTTVSNGTCQF